MDAESVGRASIPSLLTRRNKQKNTPKVGVEVMRERYMKGLNLWTGEPLQDRDNREWAKLPAKSKEPGEADEDE